MGRFGLGLKALFGVWFDGETAGKVRAALTTPAALEPPRQAAAPTPPAPAKPAPAKPAAPPKPKRSEALTLLATLQREARLVDFLKEPLDAYSDAQVGAAVRNVHRDAASTLERLFALRPVLDQAEGTAVTVPENADAGRFRLTGRVADRAHGAGTLVHGGWESTRCELPLWTGSDSAAPIVAPAEVEMT